jgi:hypothetical protein
MTRFPRNSATNVLVGVTENDEEPTPGCQTQFSTSSGSTSSGTRASPDPLSPEFVARRDRRARGLARGQARVDHGRLSRLRNRRWTGTAGHRRRLAAVTAGPSLCLQFAGTVTLSRARIPLERQHSQWDGIGPVRWQRLSEHIDSAGAHVLQVSQALDQGDTTIEEQVVVR